MNEKKKKKKKEKEENTTHNTFHRGKDEIKRLSFYLKNKSDTFVCWKKEKMFLDRGEKFGCIVFNIIRDYT